jgi:hypothetical protein
LVNFGYLWHVFVGLAICCLFVFCMMRANRGQGENPFVGYRVSKNVQLQCRHSCSVNNRPCNVVCNENWNRDEHEKNPNVHPNCENSPCTVPAYHERLARAKAAVAQLEADGPPLPKRRASVGATVSRPNDDDGAKQPANVSHGNIGSTMQQHCPFVFVEHRRVVIFDQQHRNRRICRRHRFADRFQERHLLGRKLLQRSCRVRS